MRRIVQGVFMLLFLLSNVQLIVRPAQAAPLRQSAFDPIKAQRATVYIMQMYTNTQGQAIISCVGSGTLVTPTGLILTNAHNATSSERCPSDRLAIGLTVRIGEAPVARYYAERTAVNTGWDLAVLQIVRTIDGNPVDQSTLTLPFAEIASEETNLS